MRARLDAFLLDKSQKFCDKFQRLTGRTKFQLEKWSLIAAATSYWMFVVERPSPFLMSISLMLSVSYIFVIREIESEERAFLARGELKYDVSHSPVERSNFLLFNGTFLLLGLWAFLVFLAPGFLWFCTWIVSVLARKYFSACVPKPPSKSKMREWAEKSLMFLRDQLPPAPVPIPNQ